LVKWLWDGKKWHLQGKLTKKQRKADQDEPQKLTPGSKNIFKKFMILKRDLGKKLKRKKK